MIGSHSFLSAAMFFEPTIRCPYGVSIVWQKDEINCSQVPTYNPAAFRSVNISPA